VATSLRLATSLPREAATVCAARRVLDAALAFLGVTDDCRGDISLALSEACSNAVIHAQAGDEYEIILDVDGDRCVLEVIDAGIGMANRSSVGELREKISERGRGLLLMRACTDSLELRPVHPHGLAVRMGKQL
jgi:serine/threonine-protein kinase RsbW